MSRDSKRIERFQTQDPAWLCAVAPYQRNSLYWYYFKLFLCWFWEAQTQWKRELYEIWSLETDLWNTKAQWQPSMLNKSWTRPQVYTLAWLKYWIKVKINWNSQNKNVAFNVQSWRYWGPFPSFFCIILFLGFLQTYIHIHVEKKKKAGQKVSILEFAFWHHLFDSKPFFFSF